jgi:hypothetical protein
MAFGRDEVNYGLLGRILLLGIALLMITGAQASMMDDIDVSRISEDFGKWRVSFNWSEMDEYKSSVSHGDSESGKEKIATDTLIMTSISDKSKVLKVSVVMHSESNDAPVNSSRLMTLANETLLKSGVCKEIKIAKRLIDGQLGAFASGLRCPLEEPVNVAVYSVDYRLDGSGGVLASNAIGIILSTYDQKISDRLINSIRIEQMK